MTTEELRELDAAVACGLFGWQWFRCKSRGLCVLQPPERGGWVRAAWGPDAFELVPDPPPPEQRFQDWWHGGVLLANGQIVSHGLPRYSAEIAAAWQVHQAMCDKLFSARRAYYHELRCIASEGAAGMVAWPDVLTVLKDRFPEAICRAALKAVQPV